MTTIVTAIEIVTEIVIEIVTVTVTVTIETIGTTGTTDVRILVKNPMIVIGIVVKLKQKNVSLNSYREWPHNRMTSCLSGENKRESGKEKTINLLGVFVTLSLFCYWK